MSTTQHEIFENFVHTLVAASRPPQVDRVSIISVPMEGRPGHIAYQITGLTADDVQREIDRLMTDVEIRGGQAEFRHPAKSRAPQYFGKWQTVGYTHIVPVPEAV